MDELLARIRACTICAAHLPAGPRPIIAGHPSARIVIIGQAPGRKVHASGIAWDDASGRNLRAWMAMSEEVFYDPAQVALVPMGFCYPGTGRSGDLPPRPECAPEWHAPLLDAMPNIQLTLLIGMYAQRQYLGTAAKKTLTETVAASAEYGPGFLPLPHPSPRNNIWQRRNPWFGTDVLPTLQERVAAALD